MHINQVHGKSALKYHEQAFLNNSLIGHSLAVAAVASEIIRRPTVQKKLAELGLSQHTNWLIVLVALHDIGKCAPEFQLRIGREEESICWDVMQTSESRKTAAEKWNHGEHGYNRYAFSLIKHISSQNLLSRQARKQFADCLNGVCAHHTQYASELPDSDAPSLPSYLAVHELFDVVQKIVASGGLSPWQLTNISELLPVVHWLAGWTVLADWLGSEESNFRPIPVEQLESFKSIDDLASHLAPTWNEYLQQAAVVVDSKSLFKSFLDEGAGYAQELDLRFKAEGFAGLNEMQSWAVDVKLPMFTIVESPMGAGKTELAMILANRFVQSGLASGVVFALPTQSTANKIHDRLDKEIAQHWYGAQGVLAHGNAWIRNTPDDADSSSIDALEWLSSNTKRALLAPVTVCTVDQVQKLALYDRHSQLRAAALSRQCLIIDEVHSYDTYMSRIIESVLEFAGMMKIPVVLMSATLPNAIKKRFIAAYQRVDESDVALDTSKPYPRITTEYGVTPLKSMNTHNNCYQFKPISHSMIPSLVDRLTKKGRTVGVICNSVDSAIALQKKLQAKGIEGLLFHARYTLHDRTAIEELVTSRFGKDSRQPDRQDSNGRGRVIIATQVAEQSLDIDVDDMISEICPIDLLLQRAGRLQRHNRGYRGIPTLYVAMPNVDARWFAATSMIYKDTIIDATATWLGNGRTVPLPAGISDAVDSIYDGLCESENELKHRNVADHRVFYWKEDLNKNMERICRSRETRLGDPSYSILMLVRNSDGSIAVPFGDRISEPSLEGKKQFQHNLDVSARLVTVTDHNAPDDGFGKKMLAIMDVIETPAEFWNVDNRYSYDFVVLGCVENGRFVSAKNKKQFSYSPTIGLMI